jgi:hypothetical protein
LGEVLGVKCRRPVPGPYPFRIAIMEVTVPAFPLRRRTPRLSEPRVRRWGISATARRMP